MKFVPKAAIAALVGIFANSLFLKIKKSGGGFIVRARKRQSSAGITECVDHDDGVAGMKEAVVVSHNQDTISAIHKIVGLSNFFVSHGCMCFATLIRISRVAAIRPLVCAKYPHTNLNDPFSGLRFVC